ncbi:MAG: heat-inducible transcription repressor HrcA [Acidobacteriota bacterium]|nr:heat-inducible transcription repressor HrcA [Acidobacteriota bacterium]
MLTHRQQSILWSVVEGYLRTGQPVASKTVAAVPEIACSPSTVRNELALLEEQGLLAHPHTSAGRVPTDAGHRYVVDRILAAPQGASAAGSVELSLTRQEVEQAMRVTTETLSEVTSLLAVVTAPSPQAATIRHIEVLALQPDVVAVVVITSAGGVSKTLVPFDRPVDGGLVSWAGAYLGERLKGLELGARMLQQRLADPTLLPAERAFLDRLSSAFDDAAGEAGDVVYIDGTAHLISAGSTVELANIEAVMGLLERRVAVLEMICASLAEPDVYVRIGAENADPAMRAWALVATGYGVPQRKLGAVSVIGPVCMDYAHAITAVRHVAGQLSRFVEDAYAAG